MVMADWRNQNLPNVAYRSPDLSGCMSLLLLATCKDKCSGGNSQEAKADLLTLPGCTGHPQVGSLWWQLLLVVTPGRLRQICWFSLLLVAALWKDPSGGSVSKTDTNLWNVKLLQTDHLKFIISFSTFPNSPSICFWKLIYTYIFTYYIFTYYIYIFAYNYINMWHTELERGKTYFVSQMNTF